MSLLTSEASTCSGLRIVNIPERVSAQCATRSTASFGLEGTCQVGCFACGSRGHELEIQLPDAYRPAVRVPQCAEANAYSSAQHSSAQPLRSSLRAETHKLCGTAADALIFGLDADEKVSHEKTSLDIPRLHARKALHAALPARLYPQLPFCQAKKTVQRARFQFAPFSVQRSLRHLRGGGTPLMVASELRDEAETADLAASSSAADTTLCIACAGTSSISVICASILKNAVGIGIFALPGLIAKGVSPIQVALMVTTLGALSAHAFFLLGRAALETNATDNDQLWANTMGSNLLPMRLGVLLMAYGSCVQYLSTLVELVPPLLPLLGFSPARGLTQLTGNLRAVAILLISSCLYPMCTANDLYALRHVSSFGTVSVIYSTLFVLVRAMDGSYAPGGKFFASAAATASALPPAFGLSLNPATLAFAGCVNTAFMAHLSVPRYAHELRNPTPRRFGLAVAIGFTAVALLSMAVGIAGVATFGSECKGLLLLNYDLVRDRAAQLVCAATFISVLTGFPLVFLAMRDALVTWITGRYAATPHIGKRDLRSMLQQPKVLSLLLCALCALGSMVAKDVAFVIALRGAFLGSLVNFAIPALVFLRSAHGRNAQTRVRRAHKAMVGYGVLAAAASTWQVLRLGLAR